jgi:hypothetical protein
VKKKRKKRMAADASRTKYLETAARQYEETERARAAQQEEHQRFAAKVFVGCRYPDTTPDYGAGRFDKVYDALDEVDRHCLTVLHANSGDGIKSIALAPNRDCRDMGGHVITFGRSKKFVFSDVFPTDTAFTHTSALHLEALDGLSLKQLRTTHKKRLSEYMQTVSTQGPDILGHFPNKDFEGTTDMDDWPTFFPKGSHIGLYSKGGKTFVIASTHAGESALTDLEQIAAEPEMTAAKFVEDPRVSWCSHMVYRNICSLLHSSAEALGCPVTFVRDINHFVSTVRQPQRPMARPSMTTVSNTCRTSRSDRSRPAFFVNTIDPHASHSLSGHHRMLVHSGHLGGYSEMRPESYHPMDTPFYPATTSYLHPTSRYTPTSSEDVSMYSKRLHVASSEGSASPHDLFPFESFEDTNYGEGAGYMGISPTMSRTFAPAFVYSP